MANMLGKDGSWWGGYPCGATNKIMRKSGRMRNKRAAEREVRTQMHYDHETELGYDLDQAELDHRSHELLDLE